MKIFKHNISIIEQVKEMVQNPTLLSHKIKSFLTLFKQSYYLKPALSQLKSKTKEGGWRGAEIGVFRGDNARNVLRSLNIDRFYLIDPYTNNSRAEKEAKSKIKSNKAVWIKMRSDEAVAHIPNRDLDFVYIDGDHSYNQAKRDIINYFPKLKQGGLLSGHDYRKPNAVSRAVNEFVQEHNLNLNVSDVDWWVWKE